MEQEQPHQYSKPSWIFQGNEGGTPRMIENGREGRRPKPCKTEGCGHMACNHNRSKKIKNFWTGHCTVPDCTCKEYTI